MVFKFLKASYTTVKNALVKTGSLIGSRLRTLFQGKIDETTFDKLEELLYEADLGVQYAQELTAKVRESLRKDPSLDSEALIQKIREEILKSISSYSSDLKDVSSIQSPLVILIIGVNGNGKTTSVAKLARRYQVEGKKVLIAGADTFRAAAMEQLALWAERLGVEIVKGNAKSDPASVAFDAVTAGKARGLDVVIVDTAGRLHTKTPLMQELAKIRRSCSKVSAESPHETLLVLDATTGQNAIDQAKTFHQFTPITGLILTKLDGTAKGGIVLAIQKQLGIPIKFIGVGEGMDDLQPFDAERFVNTLFE